MQAHYFLWLVVLFSGAVLAAAEDKPPVVGNEVTSADMKSPAVERSEVKSADVKAPAIVGNEVRLADVKSADVKPPPVEANGVKSADVKAPVVERIEVKSADVKAPAVERIELKSADVKSPVVERIEVKSADVKAPAVERSEVKSADVKAPALVDTANVGIVQTIPEIIIQTPGIKKDLLESVKQVDDTLNNLKSAVFEAEKKLKESESSTSRPSITKPVETVTNSFTSLFTSFLSSIFQIPIRFFTALTNAIAGLTGIRPPTPFSQSKSEIPSSMNPPKPAV